MKIFIIHGAYGNPEENWFPWLKEKLIEQGHEVIVPHFPTPENQTLTHWMDILNLNEIDSDTVFVGHSLGPAFILSVLEKINVSIKACFFIAGFVDVLGKKEFDSINESFVRKSFDWYTIKRNCKKFYVYSSDNDPYVPLSKGKALSDHLASELIIVKDAGHFNEAVGFKKFDQLLRDILKDLNS